MRKLVLIVVLLLGIFQYSFAEDFYANVGVEADNRFVFSDPEYIIGSLGVNATFFYQATLGLGASVSLFSPLWNAVQQISIDDGGLDSLGYTAIIGIGNQYELFGCNSFYLIGPAISTIYIQNGPFGTKTNSGGIALKNSTRFLDLSGSHLIFDLTVGYFLNPFLTSTLKHQIVFSIGIKWGN